ncbi:MAG: lipocalin-like domain-containing protein [Chloroflexota bacterium]
MTIQEALIGTWRLISQETEFADGSREFARGENPDGILMYDALGNMSVHLVRSDDPLILHTDLTQFDTAMGQYHGYFGTYEINETEQIVYHNIVGSAFPLYRGTRQVRHFRLEGNRLYLSSGATIAGDDTKRFLIWEKLETPYPRTPSEDKL